MEAIDGDDVIRLSIYVDSATCVEYQAMIRVGTLWCAIALRFWHGDDSRELGREGTTGVVRRFAGKQAAKAHGPRPLRLIFFDRQNSMVSGSLRNMEQLI